MALARQRNERGRTPTPAPTTIWPVAVKAPFFFVLLTVSCVLPVACWLLLCLSPSLSLSCASHLFHYTVTLCVCVYADFFVVIYLYFVLEWRAVWRSVMPTNGRWSEITYWTTTSSWLVVVSMFICIYLQLFDKVKIFFLILLQLEFFKLTCYYV